ncbi:carbohydrate sulfotransferase 12-like [Myripristis murdjan]|uniref:carbohydrate sulfotransferase 12-like n=1 Tax=Myripristis murdjan TaxID=586833 RepID=UPI00117625FD|nr:carbohydrate sulfotransferase 12-like [Myripristis murdjan]
MLQGKRGLAVLQQQQEQRKQLLREMCGDRVTSLDKEQILANMPKNKLKNLIVDDKHGIIYCYIPKVACTNWKRVLFVLKQTEPYQDPMNISGDVVQHPNTFKFLNSFPLPEMKARLEHYTKFLFVRDPFVRLISAYRDKFQKNNKYHYHKYACDMLRKYSNQSNPPKSADKAFALDIRPSFYNFIQYLLDPRTEKHRPFDEHWRQMHRLCHPCLIEYDFVGHQESLQEDAEHLLRILKLQDVIKFPPSYDNMTNASWVSDWFRVVPLEARRKLYKLYEMDFKLFGYGKPSTLLND